MSNLQSTDVTVDMDPVTLAVVWNSLSSISEEMGAMLKRTAFSPGVREAQDFSTAIYSREGRLIAHRMATPGHLGAGIHGVPKVIAALDEDMLKEGDGIIYNDLSLSVGHLPDFFCLTPIFVNQQLLGFAVSSAHMIDVGGLAPGSLAIEGVPDVYAEGLRVTPIKLFRAGAPNPDVFELINANVRLPDKVSGDLHAAMNANRLGVRRVTELMEKYGLATALRCFEGIFQRSEEVMREAIHQIPNGTYSFEDELDDYGIGTDPLRIVARITVENDHISVDFSGSSPQVPAGINSYFGFTFAYTLFALKSVIDPSNPTSHGTIVPFQIFAPEGCFLNPRHPAPAGGRAIVLTRIVDVILGALSKALPDSVVAAPSSFVNACLGGTDPATGEPFVYFELLFGGSGAGANRDGVEAICSGLDVNNIPIEVSESSCPIIVRELTIIPDSGGPGRHRGGCGIRKDIELLTDGVTFTNMSDRVRTAPYGLFGGGAGTNGQTIVHRGTEEISLASKGVFTLKKGDILSLRLGGAGGYGPAQERSRPAVISDVREGFVSREGAEKDYGVRLASTEGWGD